MSVALDDVIVRVDVENCVFVVVFDIIFGIKTDVIVAVLAVAVVVVAVIIFAIGVDVGVEYVVVFFDSDVPNVVSNEYIENEQIT